MAHDKRTPFRSPNKPDTSDRTPELGESVDVDYCPDCGAIIEENNDCYECGWTNLGIKKGT